MNVESSVERKCICEPRKDEQLLKDDSTALCKSGMDARL